LGQDRDGHRDKQYRSYLDAELEAARLYMVLAEAEGDDGRAQIFRELVDAEMRHAAKWAEKLGIDPSGLEPARHGIKSRLLKWGAGALGTRRVLPVLLRLEADEIGTYMADPEATDLVAEERIHSRMLRDMASAGAPGRGGSVRAAVLGVNDGLVSNFSLVMGVAGGTGNADFILLAGVAGLLAGAFSMAAGEYVSMRSQRDIFENEMHKEEIELREWPAEEEEELRLIYQAKGFPAEEAAQVAKRVMADPKVALDTMAREELGLDPSQLGSPWRASASSFVAFIAGALVPILPYVVGVEDGAVVISAVLSATALALVGGLIALLSGRSVAWGGLRMLLAGGAAAAVTFGVGRLIGVSVTRIA
jgi:VIT1/CCC1 family predicted Fe2+/Mn2+ transporter